MEKSVATLDQGTTCSSWNYCGQRMATGSNDGMVAIFDSVDPASSSFTPTTRFRRASDDESRRGWRKID